MLLRCVTSSGADAKGSFFETGTIYTFGIATSPTTGSSIAGMTVGWTYLNGGTNSAIWECITHPDSGEGFGVK
jgi:hypothetical protein